MTLLVTGATGALGSRIVNNLTKRGSHVRVLIRPPLERWKGKAESVIGDITEPETLHSAFNGIDTVIHCAAKVDDWGNWSNYRQVNVEGTRNLLNAAVSERID